MAPATHRCSCRQSVFSKVDALGARSQRRQSASSVGRPAVERPNVKISPVGRPAAKLATGIAIALSTAGVDPCFAESTFTPGTVEVGWEIYFGAAAGVFPFIIGAWEFGKRIVIQRRCAICEGSGLVERGRFLRKCPECGGFFPWQGWDQFFSATASPGNGGVLRQPRGQKSVLYKVPPQKELEANGPNSIEKLEVSKKGEEQ